MPLLTINAVVYADPKTSAVLQDAMFCATKVYNGLLYEIQETVEKTGKLDTSLKTLNGYLKRLPRAKGYHSLSVQATRDEVIGAWDSFKALQANGHTQHNTPGFRRKTEYSGLRYYGDNGVWLDWDVKTKSDRSHSASRAARTSTGNGWSMFYSPTTSVLGSPPIW